MIGQTISHYKILAKLGEGGMGVVYKAHDEKLDRTVAIKFLLPQFVADEKERTRFLHEARAASALDHPNICTFYELDQTPEGNLFIAMAYYEGQTLKEKIAERPLPLDETIDLAVGIASGLSKAHEKKIVHRDIKSENVMITTDAIPKIMDFGLAHIIDATKITKTGATLGTVPYMSPEQARGEKVDHRADIWSFGAVLYEMITGRVPFKSEYRDAIVYMILNQNPEPVTSLRSNVPMELERVINKCLEKNASDRYQHVDEIVTDLRVLQKESKGEKTSGRRPLEKWKRQTLIYGTLAALGVLVAVGLFMFKPSLSEAPANSKTIAVLPFTNFTGSPDVEYFSDGITEDILTQLTKVADLNVISRTTMMQYKGTKKSLREIAQELNAGVVLEGSVRQTIRRVRIVSQLIDAQSDKHLWGETYDREMKDVLEIQSDVAQKIAAALGAKLSSAEKQRLEATKSSDPEAYKLLLEGRYYAGRGGKENYDKAIDLYKQAIEIDSNDARVWSSLAFTYVGQAVAGYVEPQLVLGAARNASERAILLDDQLANGHQALGWIKQTFDWDWEGAEAEFRQVLSLEPGNSSATGSLASLSASLGKFDEAIMLYRKSMGLAKALTNGRYEWLAFFLMYANRLDEAVIEAKRGLELNLHDRETWPVLGQLYVLQGKVDSAMIVMEKELESVRLYVLALAHYVAGRKAQSDSALKELIAKYSKVAAFQIAEVYAYRGDADNAFKWLEKAYEIRDTGLTALKGDPFLKNIERDPRYVAFMKKMRLPL